MINELITHADFVPIPGGHRSVNKLAKRGWSVTIVAIMSGKT